MDALVLAFLFLGIPGLVALFGWGKPQVGLAELAGGRDHLYAPMRHSRAR